MSADPIAAMRHRLIIEQPVDTPDGQGGAARTWVTVATVWGALRALSASERTDSEAVEHAVTHRAVIRWRSHVTADMRLRLDARTFAIIGLRDPGGKRAWLEIDAEETGR